MMNTHRHLQTETRKHASIPLIAGSTVMSALLILAACVDEERTVAAEDPWQDRITLSISGSIGADSGDSNYVFGAVGDVCHGHEGQILVMDQAGSHVRVFSREGEYLDRFSGRGEGPGEVSIPLALASLDDGRVILLDPGANSYEVFDIADYAHLDEWALWDNNPPMDPVGMDNGHYIGMKFVIDQSDGELTGINTLGRFAPGEADPEIVYFREEFPVDPSDIGSMVKNMLMSTVFTGDRLGRGFYSPMSTSDYRILAFDCTGSSLFTVEQSMPMVPRSPAEIEEEKAYMEQWISRMGGMGGLPVEWRPEPFRYMIVGLGVDSRGRLWAQRGTETNPVFDVFDEYGEHIFSAEFPMSGNTWRFHIDALGILAWEEDPSEGLQRIYIVEEPGDAVN